MFITKTFTIDEVEEVVKGFFNTTSEALKKQYRGTTSLEKVWPKHLFVYCLYHFTDVSVIKISAWFGLDRGSIYNSIDVVNKMCATNPGLKNQVIELEGMFE
jgi:chromosomal replication initiation ATPase DnaA